MYGGSISRRKYAALRIHCESIQDWLLPGEDFSPTKGYSDHTDLLKWEAGTFPIYHRRIWARNEAVNGRLKRYNVLNTEFRNFEEQNCLSLYSITKLKNFVITYEELLFFLSFEWGYSFVEEEDRNN